MDDGSGKTEGIYADPMAIYEVHPGSWMVIRQGGRRLLYLQRAGGSADPVCDGYGLHAH